MIYFCLASYDSDWVNNAAGYHVNHKYGFGVVDAGGAVSLARTHTLLSGIYSAFIDCLYLLTSEYSIAN